MSVLAVRSHEEERMDAADLAAQDYAAVLRDLAAVNRITFAARPTLRFLARATRGMTRFRLLDVGFGQGDMLRAIAAWAERRGISAELFGIDLNPNGEDAARAVTPPGMPIRYATGDYAALTGQGFDFIVSSLVTHHMDDAAIIAFLRFMEREAVSGWFVNDLHRHRFAHSGFPLLAALLRWHPIVRHDGRLSIARSFRPAEWRTLIDKAGIARPAVTIARAFPFRLCVARVR